MLRLGDAVLPACCLDLHREIQDACMVWFVLVCFVVRLPLCFAVLPGCRVPVAPPPRVGPEPDVCDGRSTDGGTARY